MRLDFLYDKLLIQSSKRTQVVEILKRLKDKKQLLFILGLIVILLCSFAVELYGFNGGIMALASAERTVVPLGAEDLLLTDLALNEDGSFAVTGESPSIQIDSEQYIGKLCLETSKDTALMHVKISNSNKVYDINHRMKEVSVLRVMDDAENVQFAFTMDNQGDDTISFASLAVDNTLTVNWLRVFAMVSIGGMILFFVLFHALAVQKLHISFLILAVVFGVNLALATPAWYGFDEGAHFVRAYQFAQFDLGLDSEKEISWVNDIDDFFYYTGRVNAPHYTYDEREAFISRYATHDYGVEKHIETTAATYPFVPYFFAGVGILLARLIGLPFVHTFYAGRIFNVLGYALVCFFAIKHAKLGKRLLFFMALVPYALFSAGVYTADTLTVSFTILAMALYLNMLVSEDRALDWKYPSMFALSVAAMALCKLPYAPFCLLILSVPMKKFKSNKQAVLNWVLVFAIVGFVSVATLLFGAGKGIIQWYEPGMSIVGQVKFILTHIPQYIMIMLGHVVNYWKVYLGDSTTGMAFCGGMGAFWTVLAVFVPIVLAVTEREEGNHALTALPKLACVVTVACSWALVLTALYVSFNVVAAPTIRGVQGRYFYPLLLPLLFLLKNNKLNLPIDETKWNVFCIGIVVALNIAAVAMVFGGYCM